MLKIEISDTGEVSVGNTPRTMREQKGNSLLDLPESYVVIDIEATGLDPRFDEIIELAGIKYADNVEIDRFQSLVKAEVSDFITELTGITNDMLRDAPEINDVLPRFLSFVGDSVVVGHSVNFDINFIYDNAEYLNLTSFSNDFIDTLRLSRRLYKGLPNHKLSTLCNSLGVPQPIEHRALEDCQRTNSCYQAMKQYIERTGVSLRAPWEGYSALAKTISAKSEFFNTDGPIFQKAFVFTGTLERMTRQEAMQAVADCGGICQDGVTKKTDYLVLGNNDYCASIKGGKSSKQKKAEKMQLEGFEIQIISENVFYDMLQDSVLPPDIEDSNIPREKIVKADQMTLFDGPISTEEEIHAVLEPALHQVLDDNNILPHHLSFSRKKEYSSCVYKASKANADDDIRGGIIYRVRMRGENCYLAVKRRYSPWIPSQVSTKETPDGYVKIFIRSAEEAKVLSPLLAKILSETIECTPKEFDCCSRFEECSSAKKCIHPDPEFSLNCSYKFKLKQGKIFFGANRNAD